MSYLYKHSAPRGLSAAAARLNALAWDLEKQSNNVLVDLQADGRNAAARRAVGQPGSARSSALADSSSFALNAKRAKAALRRGAGRVGGFARANPYTTAAAGVGAAGAAAGAGYGLSRRNRDN